jgi:hypothetical protein
MQARRVLTSLLITALMLTLLAPPRATAASADDARTIARDAYLFGYPLMLMQLTKQFATRDTANGQFIHMQSAPTPPFRIVVAPNGDTRYSSAWVDVSAEPQVMHVPDAGGRYFVAQVMDMWTDVIADPTPRLANAAPRDYAIVGPQWNGALPSGLTMVRSSTNDVWILARTRPRPGDDANAITSIQQQYSVVPLSRFGEASYRPPPGILRDPNVPIPITPPSILAGLSGASFLSLLSISLLKYPPRAGDAPLVARLAQIGFVVGKPFDPKALDPAQLGRIEDGVRDAHALLETYDAPAVPHVNGWRWTKDTGRFGTDYTYRAFIAKTLLAANLPEDAVYPETSVDASGAPLSGERRYSLHFVANDLPPAKAFWSLTLYSPDHYLVPNPIDRYTLRDANARRNADGSIDVIIQHDSPSGDQTNWLPAPAGPFVVTLRMYWPGPSGLDGTYKVPAIQPR